MPKILGMTREQILAINSKDIRRLLMTDEVVYMAETLGAFWKYDYAAADAGKVGMHAILKSGLHSDGFFMSRVLLGYENILEIMARQMVRKIEYLQLPKLEWVAGIPDGATKLGEKISEITGAKLAKLEKVDGRIILIGEIPDEASLLLVEDFCTKGTGFKETVREIIAKNSGIFILPLEFVILNRGGLSEIIVDRIGPHNWAQSFRIISIAEKRITEWDPDSIEGCALCKKGSEAIKPKATDENWRLITTSQLQS